jgi:hypothetical protein
LLAVQTAVNPIWSADLMRPACRPALHPSVQWIDDFNREGMWIEVGVFPPSERVIRSLTGSLNGEENPGRSDATTALNSAKPAE